MRVLPVVALVVLSALPAGAAPRRSAKTAPKAAPAAPAAASRFAWPGDSREALELPAEAWSEIVAAGPLPRAKLGYTTDEMRQYSRDRALLRTVDVLFHDAPGVTRYAGRITDEMLAVAHGEKQSLADLVRQAYVLTDVSAARFFPAPAKDDWGVAWIPKDANPAAALEIALARCAPERGRMTRRERDAVLALPEAVQRAVTRVLAGADLAAPWLDLAYRDVAPPSLPGDVSAAQDALHALAIAPWNDEENGMTATRSAASLRLVDDVDREHLAYGSVIFLLHAELAVSELRAAAGDLVAPGPAAPGPAAGSPVEIMTRFGLVRITGTGADDHASPCFFELDLGGKDRWTGRHGVPQAPGSRLALAVDLAGDDTWDGGGKDCALGCGLFGLGAVIDAAGDDSWSVSRSGLGSGWMGTGLLADLGGRDAYVVKDSWGQGSGHVGVGLLLDVAGDDTYECAQQSQGLGSTLGAGVLVDVAGDDAYVARDDGNVSPLYLDQSVAMAQGCGYGRRADLGDGHSLAGGVGVLLDGAGNDTYHAQVWAQGAGYWWSLGILEDRGGDDTYENGKYSAGAGAHFAIGSFVDLSGNDRYNVGSATAVNQYHGHARDGSIGIAVDGDGNDRYYLRGHCAGSGDLGSVGLFWDRRGDDSYEVSVKDMGAPNGWNETPPMGSATWYPPYRSWRDELPTVGVFLDTGGTDVHSSGSPGGDNRKWTRPHAPASHGIGLDVEWYPRRE